MPTQYADDAGRQVREPWLGAKGAKWLWEWTYGEWKLAAAVFVASVVLLPLVIPSGVVAFLLARTVANALSRNADDPQRTFRLVAACMAGLAGVYSLARWDLTVWARPLFFPVALFIALVLPFVAVRKWGRYVNWNRPIAYWLRLPGKVARGPRQAKVTILDPTPLLPDTEDLDTDTDDLVPGRIVTVRKPWRQPKARPTKAPRPTPTVKAKITKAPKRPAKVPARERRLVQPGAKPRNRRRLIERTPTGLRVGNTEYRMENY